MLKKLSLITLVAALVVINAGIVLASDLSQNKITDIKVAGNKIIEQETILTKVKTKVGDNISKKQLRQDMQNILDLGYFSNLNINFESYQGGVRLIFKVVENPTLSKIKIKGNKVVSAEKIKQLLGVKAGKILNFNELKQGTKKVNQHYKDKGYILAQIVGRKLTDDNQLYVEVNEGKLNKILIEGNKKTKEYVIRRNLSVTTEQIFNVNKLKTDIRRLYRTGYFEKVDVKFKPVKNKRQLTNLIIEVKEGKNNAITGGLSYSNQFGVVGLIELERNNLFGRGHKVDLNWEYGKNKNKYDIGFYTPWLFESKTSLDVNLYNNEAVTAKGNKTDREGGNISLGHPLAKDIKAYCKLDISQVKDADGNQRDNRDLTVKTVRDTRDSIYFPTLGSRESLSIEEAGLFGGDNDFTKYELDLRKYFAVGSKGSVAARVKLGVADGYLPESERYYMAGLGGLRGYKSVYNNQNDEKNYNPRKEGFEGDAMVLGNLEYRFKIIDKLTGVAFFDTGKAFNHNLNGDDFNYSLGVGVAVEVPMLGVINLDYGYAPDGELNNKTDLRFTMGARF